MTCSYRVGTSTRPQFRSLPKNPTRAFWGAPEHGLLGLDNPTLALGITECIGSWYSAFFGAGDNTTALIYTSTQIHVSFN